MSSVLPKTGAFCGFLLLLLLSSPTPAAPSTNRLTLAVTEFENKTGQPELDHWGYCVRKLLKNGLSEVKSLKVLGDETENYGYRYLRLKEGDPLDSAQVGRMGAL